MVTQSLGVVLTRERKFQEAEQSLRHALALRLMRFPETHWEVAMTKNLLGACLMDQKNFKAAEPLLVDSYAVIKNQFGLQHDRTRRAGSRLISLYEATGNRDKSATRKAELGITN